MAGLEKYGAIDDTGIRKKDSMGYKQKQERQLAKQEGQLPPDKDEATGEIINPHNPEFITKVPWYLGESGPSLKHHTVQKDNHELSMSEQDSLIQAKLKEQKLLKKQSKKTIGTTAFRKGACKNCGAMTHKEKDCMERPRSKSKQAATTGKTIASDEVVFNINNHGKVNYAAKRDSWRGYDPTKYNEVVKQFEVVDSERTKRAEADKAQRKREHDEAIAAGKVDDNFYSDDSDAEGEKEDDDDAFKLKDEEAVDFQGRHARQGGVGGAQMKTTVRNLRIREDIPKYLRNLDMNSAFYDPKTRSMRMNPNPHLDPSEQAFAGDNFVRNSGDAAKLAQAQVLCWDMETNQMIDPIVNPSAAEKSLQQIKGRNDEEAEKKAIELSNRYGDGGAKIIGPSVNGSSSSSNGMEKIIYGVQGGYSEYTSDGRIVKGDGAAISSSSSNGHTSIIVKTKYEEDVFPGNHTSIWGSYWSKASQGWGYQCCHSMIYASYCIGAKGKVSESASDAMNNVAESTATMINKKESKLISGSSAMSMRNDLYGDADVDVSSKLDQTKLREAMLRAENGNDDSTDGNISGKRAYNSLKSTDVSLEEMEVYRMKRQKGDDPLNNLSSDSILPMK